LTLHRTFQKYAEIGKSTEPETMSPLLVTRQTASKRLGISRVVFTKLEREGKLPGPHMGTKKYLWPAVYRAINGKDLPASDERAGEREGTR
jgi:hypothetical protein